MTDPCGGPLNLLRNQYQRWWTSVFLTITSECANIPAFSYLRASGLHRFILPKFARLSCGTLSCGSVKWKKQRVINGLFWRPNRIPFFEARLALDEGRSCGPATASCDRQFFRSDPDQAAAVRK